MLGGRSCNDAGLGQIRCALASTAGPHRSKPHGEAKDTIDEFLEAWVGRGHSWNICANSDCQEGCKTDEAARYDGGQEGLPGRQTGLHLSRCNCLQGTRGLVTAGDLLPQTGNRATACISIMQEACLTALQASIQ